MIPKVRLEGTNRQVTRTALVGSPPVKAPAGLRLSLCLALLTGCSSPVETHVWVRPGGAGPRELTPFWFIHAGDPQIGGWTSIEDTRDRFIRLAHLANELQPAFVAVVGDLVNGGADPDQLAAFDQALREFRVPVRLIPGNHDDLATFRARYGRDYYAFTHNNCEFVCLNSVLFSSLRRTDAARDEAGAQWKWLEEALRNAEEQKRAHVFLVLHHPPLLLPLAKSRLDGLIRRYGVQVVLCGHVHRTQEYVEGGHVVYTVAGTGWTGDERKFGYRVFKVFGDRIEQDYVSLDTPVGKVRAMTSGCEGRSADR